MPKKGSEQNKPHQIQLLRLWQERKASRSQNKISWQRRGGQAAKMCAGAPSRGPAKAGAGRGRRAWGAGPAAFACPAHGPARPRRSSGQTWQQGLGVHTRFPSATATCPGAHQVVRDVGQAWTRLSAGPADTPLRGNFGRRSVGGVNHSVPGRH